MHDPRDLLTNARIELARYPLVLEALLNGLADATWRARPAPAEWAPVEIVCHLRDEEVEDFGEPADCRAWTLSLPGSSTTACT